MTTKFALLSYSTNNLGDEIQSLAAQQFLPSKDLLVDRDSWQASSPNPVGPYKIILNGWFTHSPQNWPPPAFLSPVLTSMHISRERWLPTTLVAPSIALMQGRNLSYFREHAPVGARDRWTASLLADNGVDSYFSGCATLTLGAERPYERADYICSVDLSDDLHHMLGKRSRSRVLRLTHRETGGGTFDQRCAAARRLLSIYARATCVVTQRLHCALPCLALGTPVLLVFAASDPYRFDGLLDLVRHCTPEALKSGQTAFDLDHPEPNSGRHTELRQNMIARLTAFTGTPMQPFEPASLAAIETAIQHAARV